MIAPDETSKIPDFEVYTVEEAAMALHHSVTVSAIRNAINGGLAKGKDGGQTISNFQASTTGVHYMPRRRQPARLWLRKDEGVWVILDSGKQIRTGNRH